MSTDDIARMREISRHLIDPTIAVDIFENLPDAIIVVDDKGEIQFVNRQAELLFGYHRRDLHDRPIEILIPQDAKERHVQHRTTFMAAPRTRPMSPEVIFKALRQNGTEFTAEINLSPIVASSRGVLILAVIRKRE